MAWADLTVPSSTDRRITISVTNMLGRDHVSQRRLDDEMSERFLKTFLEALDPQKLYFYQSDIDTFNQSKTQLDDLIIKGDVNFAYLVFNTFLARIDERVKTALELLNEPHDFTVDEEIVTDPEQLSYVKDQAEARERWRKRVKYDLLVLKARDVLEKEKEQKAGRNGQPLVPLAEAGKSGGVSPVEKLTRRYKSLARRMHQIDSSELLEMYLTALTTSYDPHTSYMSPDTLENFEIQMRLQLAGIGAALQSEDGDTIVSKLIPDGPAARDGHLKKKDHVVGVGQGPDGEIVDVIDMKLSDVVDLIRGKEGTVVRLKVVRAGEEQPLVIPITRAKVELNDSAAQGSVFEAGRRPDGRPYKVGVIDLPSFYMDMNGARLGKPDFRSTSRDVGRILEGFRAQGVEALILDLRKNGGGALEEAIKLTGMFIDRGPVVQVKNAFGEVESYQDRDRGTAWDGPLVVLISKFSASASEIFAGAIQDYGRGLVVGDSSTHGKGSVQSLKDISWELFRGQQSALGALKITMQQFYRPSGDSTQNRGVVSDVELPALSSHLPVGESDLPYALPFDKVDKAAFEQLHMADPDLVKQLKGLSGQRTQQSKEFQREEHKIERYLAQKERKAVTLNEEKFLAERKEFNAEEAEEDQLEAAENPDSTTIKRDYYLDEAMAITCDYVRLRFDGRIVDKGVSAR
ncbi:MAG: carboxy terminal-processing peptidase [Pirellulales bacterium]|nr:carboxy terminal-processing peptidase [Pirellulales bacterium]